MHTRAGSGPVVMRAHSYLLKHMSLYNIHLSFSIFAWTKMADQIHFLHLFEPPARDKWRPTWTQNHLKGQRRAAGQTRHLAVEVKGLTLWNTDVRL